MAIISNDFETWLQNGTQTKASIAAVGVATTPADMTGMPTGARLRLQEHVRNPRAPFTSNLSVNEFLLSRQSDMRPVAQVIGASVYRINRRKPLWQLCVSACQLKDLTKARTEAWTLATTRLLQQCQAAGGHIVIGVRHKKEPFDVIGENNSPRPDKRGHHRRLTGGPIEVSLTGTAMRLDKGPPPANPVLSTLSAQDVMALRRSGFEASGIAYGCCVYYQPLSWTTTRAGILSRPWGLRFESWEVEDYTIGFVKARRIAVQNMEDRLHGVHGDGVLQADLSYSAREVEHKINQFENEREQTGVVITVEAYGTIVSKHQAEPDMRVVPSVSLAGIS